MKKGKTTTPQQLSSHDEKKGLGSLERVLDPYLPCLVTLPCRSGYVKAKSYCEGDAVAS